MMEKEARGHREGIAAATSGEGGDVGQARKLVEEMRLRLAGIVTIIARPDVVSPPGVEGKNPFRMMGVGETRKKRSRDCRSKSK